MENKYYALPCHQTGRMMSTGRNARTIKELGEAFYEYVLIDWDDAELQQLETYLNTNDEDSIMDTIICCDFAIEESETPFEDDYEIF